MRGREEGERIERQMKGGGGMEGRRRDTPNPCTIQCSVYIYIQVNEKFLELKRDI